jgi:hypothetical protein
MLDKDRHQWPQVIDFWWALGVCNWQATQVGLACNPLGISGATQSGCCEWMKTDAACRVQPASDFELAHIPLMMQSHPIMSSKSK